MLQYFELAPIAQLSPWVECFWFMKGDGGQLQPDRVLPDGCVEIVFNLADPFRQVQRPDSGLQPLQLVAGPMTHSLLIQASGRIDLAGIRLRPGGASAFLPLPLLELQDQALGLDDLECRFPRNFQERLGNASGEESRRTLLGDAALAACRPEDSDQRVHKVCQWMQLEENASVDWLSRQAGMSGRTLERLFLRQVGLGPKRLQRILRFQKAIRRAEAASPARLRDSALDAGYYDQSHFLKDFHAFAGVPPSVYFGAEQNLMSQAFTSAPLG